MVQRRHVSRWFASFALQQLLAKNPPQLVVQHFGFDRVVTDETALERIALLIPPPGLFKFLALFGSACQREVQRNLGVWSQLSLIEQSLQIRRSGT